jgi:adenosylcobinamide-GDP ribazoletransferase
MIERLRQEWRNLWTAVTLLTRLPAPRSIGFDKDWLAPAAMYFPLVGAVVGLAAAVAFRAAAAVCAPSVASLLAVALAAGLTGGLHEDGWADFFDGIAAGPDRERMLRAMKDSRIGAAGALALILLVSGKLVTLPALPAAELPGALVGAHVLSRWSSLPLLWRLPYARPEGGMAAALASRVSGSRVVVGTILAGLLVCAALGWAALPAAAGAAAAVLVATLMIRARLGGITGDCLGATNQLVELTVLLVLACRWPGGRPTLP